MKLWTQMLLSTLVAGGAVASWMILDPKAEATLASWGISVPYLSTSSIAPNEGTANLPGAAVAQRPNSGTPGSAPGAPTGAPTGAGTAGGPGGGPGGGQRGGRSALVITETVSTGVINDRFSAIGTGAAAHTVSVTPQVSGQIASVEVGSGSMVEAGSVLVRLDATGEQIALDRARTMVSNAEQKFKRSSDLLAQRTISSVEADQARIELDTARLDLRQAELDLSQRTIVAPISGTIGILGIAPGDYVTSQSVLTTVDDRRDILVEFYVPERLVGAISVGSPVSASAIARPGEDFTGSVIAIDNRLDEASRTLRVQARIPNGNDQLRAGMSFGVTMRFPGDTYPTVDPLAIQWDSQGSYIWQVEDGKAVRIPVTIVQRNAEQVLINAEIAEGDIVVTEGVQNVRAGGAVEIANSPAGDLPDATAVAPTARVSGAPKSDSAPEATPVMAPAAARPGS